MIHINDETAFIPATELRTSMSEIKKELKLKTVIVTMKGKPVAVMENFARYKEKQDLFEALEDTVLGHIALERDKKAAAKDYLSEEQVLKKLKNRKK